MAVAAILIFQIRDFYGWRGPEDQDAASCQIASKLVNSLQRYCNFWSLKMAATAMLDFWICDILLVAGV